MPENEDPTLEARPRAPLAAPATAAIAAIDGPWPFVGGPLLGGPPAGAPAGLPIGANDGDCWVAPGPRGVLPPERLMESAGGRLPENSAAGACLDSAGSDAWPPLDGTALSAAGEDADGDPDGAAPSEPAPGTVLPEPSPDDRDGASTRLSTPSSSVPFIDTRLSPVKWTRFARIRNPATADRYDAGTIQVVAPPREIPLGQPSPCQPGVPRNYRHF